MKIIEHSIRVRPAERALLDALAELKISGSLGVTRRRGFYRDDRRSKGHRGGLVLTRFKRQLIVGNTMAEHPGLREETLARITAFINNQPNP